MERGDIEPRDLGRVAQTTVGDDAGDAAHLRRADQDGAG